MNLVKEHSGSQEVLRILFSSLVFICKIFYSLNAQVIWYIHSCPLF